MSSGGPDVEEDLIGLSLRLLVLPEIVPGLETELRNDDGDGNAI